MKSSHPLITFSIYNTDDSLYESVNMNSIDIASVVSKYPLKVRLSDEEATDLFMDIYNLHKTNSESNPDSSFWYFVSGFLSHFEDYFGGSEDYGYVSVSLDT